MTNPVMPMVQSPDRLVNQLQQNVLYALIHQPLGDRVTGQRTFSNKLSIANTVPTTIATLELPAGIWDISLMVDFSLTATTATAFQLALSTTSNAIPAGSTMLTPDIRGQIRSDYTAFSTAAGITGDFPMVIPPYRIANADDMPLYLVVLCAYVGGSVSACGSATALRVKNT